MLSTTQFPCGVYSSAGRRPYQHDRYVIHQSQHVPATLFAVADGHGDHSVGHIVSEYISRTLVSTLESAKLLHQPTSSTEQRITTAVRTIDNNSISLSSSQRLYAGSTLCSVIRHPDSLVCFNVGDSRAILVSCPPHSNTPDVVQLSRDHVCTDHNELARISRAGGIVEDGLLNGYISMSRAIGDEDLKAHRNITSYPSPGSGTYTPELFISDADVSQRPILAHDVCVVIASDGVWNRLSNRDVTNTIFKALVNGKNITDAAKAVTKRAYSKGSEDNATVVIGLLTSLPEALSLISQTGSYSKKFRKVVDGDSSHSPKSIIDFGYEFHSSIDISKGSGLKTTSNPSTAPQSPHTPRTDKKIRFPRRKKTENSVHNGSAVHHSNQIDDQKPRDGKASKHSSVTRRWTNRILSNHT